MSDGILKPEKDYSDVLEVELPKIDELLTVCPSRFKVRDFSADTF
jgi:hypothetical protein